jgi:DNA-binding Lrp family transcriptional regulator
MIDERDKSIIGLIQGDLPLEKKPFEKMAESLGMTEKEFLERVRALKREGIIRRFGATLRHQEAGFSSNAMVAWIVPDDRIEDVGRAMAAFKEVTHCYQRKPQKDWKYNLFTMVHGDDKEACFGIAERMSQATGMNKYILLFSEKEFKKTSMAYF